MSSENGGSLIMIAGGNRSVDVTMLKSMAFHLGSTGPVILFRTTSSQSSAEYPELGMEPYGK